MLTHHPTASTFYILSYSKIKDISSSNHSSVRSFLMNRRTDQPIRFTSQEDKVRGTYAKFSDVLYGDTHKLNFKHVYVEGKQEEACLGDREAIDLFVACSNHSASENVEITLMYACRLRAVQLPEEKHQFIVSKSKILLVEGEFVGASTIFTDPHQMTFINYSIFDDKGFCICKDALDYINSCPSLNATFNLDQHLFLIVPILFIAVVIKIWMRLKFKLLGKASN